MLSTQQKMETYTLSSMQNMKVLFLGTFQTKSGNDATVGIVFIDFPQSKKTFITANWFPDVTEFVKTPVLVYDYVEIVCRAIQWTSQQKSGSLDGEDWQLIIKTIKLGLAKEITTHVFQIADQLERIRTLKFYLKIAAYYHVTLEGMAELLDRYLQAEAERRYLLKSVLRIQRKWFSVWLNPYHPLGYKRMQYMLSGLAEYRR